MFVKVRCKPPLMEMAVPFGVFSIGSDVPEAVGVCGKAPAIGMPLFGMFVDDFPNIANIAEDEKQSLKY